MIIKVRCDAKKLPLGRQGENNARTLEIDIADWIRDFGAGTVQLLHQRAGDTEPYPCAVQLDGDTVRWSITNADTAFSGFGRAELRYYAGEVLAKSVTLLTEVASALGTPTEEPPEAAQDWVDRVLDAANQVEDARTAAETAADAAAQSALDAAGSADAALASKTAAAGSATTAGSSAQSASAYASAAESAKKAAETAMTGAETEKAGAVTAKTAAESAKTAAEAYANAAATSEGNAQSYADQAASEAEKAAASAQAAEDTVASVAAALAEQQRINAAQSVEIEKLQAAAEGNLYMFQQDAAEAYEKTVPTDALKWATLDKIGGKTLVWNQFATVLSTKTKTVNGVSFDVNEDGSVHAHGTATDLAAITVYNPKLNIDHQNLLFGNANVPMDVFHIRCGNAGVDVGKGKLLTKGVGTVIIIVSVDAGATVDFIAKPMIFDLTLMGLENVITAPEEFRTLFPADYYPYSEPTLMNFSISAVVSSTGHRLDTSTIVQKYFPDGLKSAGTVHDEIDFERMVAIQRVGSADEAGLAYEVLDAPIETPITEAFDPSIQVESGGTLIFENDQGADFRVPVPNQETFMIKLPGGASE